MSALATDEISLNQARYRAVAQGLPWLMSAWMINAAALSFVFSDKAPVVVWAVPLVASLVGGSLRGVAWYRRQNEVVSDEVAGLELQRVSGWMSVLGVLAGCWYSILVAYSDDKSLALLMITSGAVMAIGLFGLIHVRKGALTFTCSLFSFLTCLAVLKNGVNSILLVFLFFVGIAALVSIALNLARSFDGFVKSRSEILKKNMETQRLSDENFRLANTDMLTELGNRRRFFADLEASCCKARETGTHLAVGIVDLDGFKAINDSNGHVIGDRLLAAVAERLRGALDGVAEAYRLGGDEFAIVISGDASETHLRAIGDCVIEAIHAPILINDMHLSVGCSLGFAQFPETAKDANTLYEYADYALFHAKKTGRMKAVVFNDTHAKDVRENALIERTLRAANLEEEFYLTFQPIVDSGNNCTLLFECLARWKSPVLGLVSPGKFIVVAEQSGLISNLTPVLLRKALAAAKNWPDNVGLSFNLSGHDISSAQKVMKLISIVAQSGVSPTRIDFEVTETALAVNLEQAIANLHRLKALGSRISLDDFGTGYSSLSQIQKLPLDKIKVDGSFVRNLAESEASQKIVRSVSALSRDLNLKCVVEGVETQEQLGLLNGFGCDLIQGYFYSRPMDEAQVSGFLQKQLDECSAA